jgi:hypothetical protein
MNRGVKGRTGGAFAFCGVASVTAGKQDHLPPPPNPMNANGTDVWDPSVDRNEPSSIVTVPSTMVTVSAILYAGLHSREYGHGDPLR